MNVVLVEPEIPPNTGNVARLCAATGAKLHLIEPLGFELNDRRMKRAGMDYWQQVDWRTWPDWASFAREAEGTMWLVESGGPKIYSDAAFGPEDYLVFGRETAGLPKAMLERSPDQWLRIPMTNPQARSLNLGNCVSIVLFEALRQVGFAE
ncbi:MAG: tRNA (cytidine(34)-2'-O)-methyltransferase [Limisphaerales bacterium]